MSTSRMEIEGPSTAKKIKLVHPESNQELASTSRALPKANEELKRKCLNALVHVHIKFGNKFELTAEDRGNISDFELVTGVVLSIHTLLRQMANGGTGTVGTKVSEEITITLKKKEHKVKKSELIEMMKETLRLYGLEYNRGAEWIGTFSPLLSLVRAFTLNTQECRVGVSKIPVGSDATTIRMVPVALYGINPEHHIQCQGMMYPPNIKSNIPQTLGAGNAIVSLLRNQGTYKDKWRTVVKRHISHLPESDHILQLLEGGRNAQETAPLVSVILDILNMTTSRTVNRAFIPMGAILWAVKPDEWAMVLGSKAILNLNLKFSGLEAASLYNFAVNNGLTYKCSTPQGGAQLVFHGIWRTQGEDLGMLEFVTGQKFVNRKTLQAETVGKASKEPVALAALPLQRFSKLATACQTDLLIQNRQQLHHNRVFSGSRVIMFSENFLNNMLGRDNDVARIGSNLATMIQKLSHTREKIVKHITGKDMKVATGRTPWYEWDETEQKWVEKESLGYTSTLPKFFLSDE